MSALMRWRNAGVMLAYRYPKPAMLGQRLPHGHAAFPSVLALGGEIVARSNWRPYLDEVWRGEGNLSLFLTPSPCERHASDNGRAKPGRRGDSSRARAVVARGRGGDCERSLGDGQGGQGGMGTGRRVEYADEPTLEPRARLRCALAR